MTRRLAILATVAIFAAAPVTAFAQPSSSSRVNVPTPSSTDLGALVYLAAQTMADRAGSLAKDRPIIVATTVSIDNLAESSTFGRLTSQFIANRLAQRGYLVKDLTFARAVTVKSNTGELVLSRDAAAFSSAVNAQAVVSGTYAIAGRQIFLNLRLLSPDDGQILSSADVVLPLDHNTEGLLAAGDANAKAFARTVPFDR